MPTYTKKAQVLFTEKQFNDLQKIAKKEHKKLGTLIRKAVEEAYLKKARAQEIREVANTLLTLAKDNPVEVPFDHQEWEKDYSRLKNPASDDK